MPFLLLKVVHSSTFFGLSVSLQLYDYMCSCYCLRATCEPPLLSVYRPYLALKPRRALDVEAASRPRQTCGFRFQRSAHMVVVGSGDWCLCDRPCACRRVCVRVGIPTVSLCVAITCRMRRPLASRKTIRKSSSSCRRLLACCCCRTNRCRTPRCGIGCRMRRGTLDGGSRS